MCNTDEVYFNCFSITKTAQYPITNTSINGRHAFLLGSNDSPFLLRFYRIFFYNKRNLRKVLVLIKQVTSKPINSANRAIFYKKNYHFKSQYFRRDPHVMDELSRTLAFKSSKLSWPLVPL